MGLFYTDKWYDDGSHFRKGGHSEQCVEADFVREKSIRLFGEIKGQ